MICVSVQEKSLQGCLEVLKSAPMAELRADLCKLSLKELERVVESHPNLLITCRIANSSIEFAKEQIITAIRKGAKYVDIEIEAPVDFLEYVKTYAQVNGAKVIISYHNYEGTQSIEELELIADICRRKGADIVKIVTTAHSVSDAVRTLSLYKRGNWAKEFKSNNYSEVKDVMLLAFSMGKAGQFSRYLSLKLGAPYTYVAAEQGASTAPGQYTLEQMKTLLAEGGIELDYRLTSDSISIPCSKSVAQRAILAAAFAKGKSLLSNFEPCNDITGALEVIKQLGCRVEIIGEKIIEIESPGAEAIRDMLFDDVDLSGESKGRVFEINTGESGLLTRLITPFAAYLSGNIDNGAELRGDLESRRVVRIVGKGSILGRNLNGAAVALRGAGARCTTTNEGYLPFEIEGPITQHTIKISGKESSQTVSGLLMTLPLLPFDTVLHIVNPASTPYINLTLDVLSKFEIAIRVVESSDEQIIFNIKGGASYKPCQFYMEPDWSSASFFAVAYAIASLSEKCCATDAKTNTKTEAETEADARGHFKLLNMRVGTAQADEAILDVLRSCGVKITIDSAESVEADKSNGDNLLCDISIEAPQSLDSFEFDATNAPDLFPILTVLALFCNGTSVIKGVGRLLEKESNRAESIFTEFTTLGADLDIKDDYLYIKGGLSPILKSEGNLSGQVVPDGGYDSTLINLHSHNDHRIAMSLIVASLFMKGRMALDNIECIDKSFPSFLERL